MEPYEEAYLEEIVENLTSSMANCLRNENSDVDLLRDSRRLSPGGRLWVCGFVTSRLSMLRSSTGGNPNLTAADLSHVEDLVGRHEAAIASDLYS